MEVYLNFKEKVNYVSLGEGKSPISYCFTSILESTFSELVTLIR